MTKDATYLSQSKASLKMVKIFLDRLAALNILENSTVIVTSDHTRMVYGMFHESILTLVKPAGKIDGLQAVETPLNSLDIKKIITDELNGVDISPSYFKSIANSDRYVRFYKWDDGWDKNYLPVMVEYKIDGQAANPQSYVATGKRYIPGDFTLPLNSSFTFPEDYSKLNKIFSNSWKVVSDGVETTASNQLGRYNSINFSIKNDSLVEKVAVVLKYKKLTAAPVITNASPQRVDSNQQQVVYPIAFPFEAHYKAQKG